MKVHTHGRYKRIIISPGEYHASNGPVMISTLLGSCIAVCLYDPWRKIIGMNHFLIASSSHNLSDLPFYLSNAGRYGIHAMELLINKMMKLGARRHDLRAKIFGGASIIYGDGQEVRRFNVGHNNCLFIKDFLANELIPVEAEDLGGNCGRVVHFSNGNFAVYVRKINTGRNIQIARRDQECWNHAIKDQELLMPQEEFWL